MGEALGGQVVELLSALGRESASDMKMLFRQGGVGERKVSIALSEADVMGARRGGSAYNPTSGDVGAH